MTGSEREEGRKRDEKTTAVNMIGAVSPAARPMERIAPVMMPGMAGGMTTREMVCHWVAPRARLPSRRDDGTLRSASSVVRITVGRTIRARVICPAIRLTPRFRYKTRNEKPKRPNTMDGVPFKRSTPVRMIFVTTFSRVYSMR